MSHVSRRNFVGALSAAPMVPAAAMAQTSVRISSTHGARYTSEGIFYDLLEPETLGSKPTIVMIHGGGHTGSCFFSRRQMAVRMGAILRRARLSRDCSGLAWRRDCLFTVLRRGGGGSFTPSQEGQRRREAEAPL